jgi:hypothetical protein
MLIYHATHRDNLPSIGTHGVSTSWAQNRTGSVWGCIASMRHWAVLHCHKRHGWPVEEIVILEVLVEERVTAMRHGSGLYYSLNSWHPSQIKGMQFYDELASSPVESKS